MICGEPGSGKTLLLKAIAGLLDRREDMTVVGEVHRGGDIAMVFQNPEKQLVRQRVRSDVAFGLENQGLPRMEMEDRIHRYAASLDAETLLDRDVTELSRGQVAKVALLGCLVTEPDVIVLDEPLATLDYRNQRLLLDAIDQLRSTGTTLIVAEHDVRDLLCRADTITLVRDGRVTDEGPPEMVVPSLREAGMKLPFNTEVALELRDRSDDEVDVPIPLSMDPEEHASVR